MIMMIRIVMIVANYQQVSICNNLALRSTTHPSPCPHHPSTVLVDLQQLDVDPSHDVSNRGQDDHSPCPGLCGEVSSKSMSGNDDRAGVADKR